MRASSLLFVFTLGTFVPTIAHAQLNTGFESPAFTAGTINGQSGWSVSTVSGVATTGSTITTSNPIAGSQSLRLSDQTSLTDGTTGAFSPLFGPATGTVLSSFDFRVSNTTPGTAGGADYFIGLQSTTEALVLARINFNDLGNIRVLDKVGTAASAYQIVGTWTPGTVYNVKVLSNQTTNSLSYVITGNATPINYTGQAAFSPRRRSTGPWSPGQLPTGRRVWHVRQPLRPGRSGACELRSPRDRCARPTTPPQVGHRRDRRTRTPLPDLGKGVSAGIVGLGSHGGGLPPRAFQRGPFWRSRLRRCVRLTRS